MYIYIYIIFIIYIYISILNTLYILITYSFQRGFISSGLSCRHCLCYDFSRSVHRENLLEMNLFLLKRHITDSFRTWDTHLFEKSRKASIIQWFQAKKCCYTKNGARQCFDRTGKLFFLKVKFTINIFSVKSLETNRNIILLTNCLKDL